MELSSPKLKKILIFQEELPKSEKLCSGDISRVFIT